MALEGTRDYLQSENSWTDHQCNLQQNAVPPPVAPQFYIALDDGGIENDSVEHFLRETYTMVVGVWFRVGAYPEDARGFMQLKTDLYRATIDTLNSLERKVLQNTHHIWALVTAVNTQFSLPSAGDGDYFQSTWVYQGRSGNEITALPDQQGNAYLGRRMRFRGMRRIQLVDSIQ